MKFNGNGFFLLYGRFDWYDVFLFVRNFYDVFKVLKEKRFYDGVLRFESVKVVFLLDEFGVLYDSMFCERKDFNFFVEEFMFLVNRIVVEIIFRVFLNSVLLRRYSEFNMRKLREFELFCSKYGLELDSFLFGSFY